MTGCGRLPPNRWRSHSAENVSADTGVCVRFAPMADNPDQRSDSRVSVMARENTHVGI